MVQFDNAVAKFNAIILGELYKQEIKCWIAGGSLRDYFMGVPLKTDFDIFFPDQSQYDKTANYFKSKNAEVKWESENGMKVVYNNHTFDLVKKFFPNPIETIFSFDFTVSMFAVDGESVYNGDTTFVDLSRRQLMINKITYPASTMSRVLRYYNKGFKICNGELRKLIEAIQDMPKPEKESDVEPNQTLEQVSMSNNAFFFGID